MLQQWVFCSKFSILNEDNMDEWFTMNLFRACVYLVIVWDCCVNLNHIIVFSFFNWKQINRLYLLCILSFFTLICPILNSEKYSCVFLLSWLSFVKSATNFIKLSSMSTWVWSPHTPCCFSWMKSSFWRTLPS